MAAALAASRAGWDVRMYERVAAFSEVGAGVQLGPNVVRCLQAWGLQKALQQVAAFPDKLQVRSALSGQELGTLALGRTAVQRYGAAYATIHRADLHGLLLALRLADPVRFERLFEDDARWGHSERHPMHEGRWPAMGGWWLLPWVLCMLAVPVAVMWCW